MLMYRLSSHIRSTRDWTVCLGSRTDFECLGMFTEYLFTQSARKSWQELQGTTDWKICTRNYTLLPYLSLCVIAPPGRSLHAFHVCQRILLECQSKTKQQLRDKVGKKSFEMTSFEKDETIRRRVKNLVVLFVAASTQSVTLIRPFAWNLSMCHTPHKCLLIPVKSQTVWRNLQTNVCVCVFGVGGVGSSCTAGIFRLEMP